MINKRFRICEKDSNAGFRFSYGWVRCQNINFKNKKGSWIGVEWDRPDRGKNDGSVDGKKYFQVRHPMNGSFFKSDKFREIAEFGSELSFQKMLMGKYQNKEKCSGDGGHLAESKVVIQLVGMDKMQDKYFSNVHLLKEVSLANSTLARCGDDAIKLDLCENLDLSFTLLDHWEELLKIIKQIPMLRELQLTGNRFLDTDKLANYATEGFVFSNIEVLVLNFTEIDWEQAQSLQLVFPNLKHLHLCDNYISSLKSVPEKWSLESVNFMNNGLTWSEIKKLSVMGNLKSINVHNNPIEAINDVDGFTKLNHFSLERTKIADWKSIQNLINLPSLESLRLQSIPLENESGKTNCRMYTIARLGSLTSLNGSDVRKKEREDCERYYLRECAEEKLSLKTGLEEFFEAHPRYNELISLHGDYEEMLKKQSKESSGPQLDRVEVTIKNMASVSTDSLSIKKKFRLTFKVLSLKKLCKRLWNIPIEHQALYFTEDSENLFPELLDDDEQTLKYYGIRDGGLIYLEERDLEKEKKEQLEKESEKFAKQQEEAEIIRDKMKWQQQNML